MQRMSRAIFDCYRQFDAYTHPGKHIDLFSTLPTDLDALCDLVATQLVHPWDGSPQPEGRSYEPRSNLMVENMLDSLLHFNSAGLVMNRTLNERVIAACRENALLLTAILRYQGVPARARAGWCRYVSSNPQQYADHWVTEVWHDAEQRWLLVDSNPKKVDFPGSEFKSGGDAWLELRTGQATPDQYRQQADWFYLKLNFGHDFNTVLGEGPHYWEAPPLFHQELSQMTAGELSLLDRLAELLQEPDTNLESILHLQAEHAGLQGLQSAWHIFERTVYS